MMQRIITNYLFYLVAGPGLCLLFLLPACKEKRTEALRYHCSDAVSDSIVHIAHSGQAGLAQKVLDKAYAAIPKQNIADSVRYYFLKSQIAIFTSEYLDTSLQYTDSMLLLIIRAGKEKILWRDYAAALKQRGENLMARTYYTEAQRYISRSIQVNLLNGDSCIADQYTGVLGLLYFRQEEYDKAADCFKTATRASFCLKPALRYYYRYSNLSNTALSYTRLGELDSALYYYGQVIAAVNSQDRNVDWPHFPELLLGVTYGNMAQALQLKGDSTAAVQWYRESVRINIRDGFDQRDAAITSLRLAGLYTDMQRADSAAALLQQVSGMYDFYKYPEIRLLWLQEQWHAAVKTGRADTAVAALAYYRLKDSLRNEQNQSVAFGLVSSSREDEQRYELIDLEAQHREQGRYLWLVLALVALLIPSLIYLNRWRSRRLLARVRLREEARRKQELLLQQMSLHLAHQDEIIAQRKDISDNMHDDLSSSLAALKYFIGDIRRKADTPHMAALLARVEEEAGAVYEDARAYIHNLRAEAQRQQYDLIKLLWDISGRFAQYTALRIKLDIDEAGIRERLNPAEQEMLYHLLKEAMSNVLKHASATELNLQIRFEEEKCLVSIADNGKGIPADRQDGMGLDSMRRRIQQAGGQLSISSGPGKGTVLRGWFPLGHIHAMGASS